VTDAPVQTLAVAVPPVPGFGWTTLHVHESSAPPLSSVTVDANRLANDRLTVTIDRGRGTYSIDRDGVRVDGLGRLVDGGDAGDMYNYSPPAADRLVDSPRAVQTHVLEAGPARGRVAIVAEYDWPAGLTDTAPPPEMARSALPGQPRTCHPDHMGRTDEVVPITITTVLELRAHEPFLRVEHRFDNRARDHRLRAHFPLPHPVTGSDAECAFTVVHRGLTAEGGPQEHGLPTFPSRRFVDASDGTVGLAIVHDGLLEYEIVDGAPNGGQELALTLLRAVGVLSRPSMAYRLEPAGPPLPVPQAQLLGARVARYAVYVHEGDWRAAGLYARADEVLVPLLATPGERRDEHGSWLTVDDDAEVSAVLRDDDGNLVVRTFATDTWRIRTDRVDP
jgi:hypothetical protein